MRWLTVCAVIAACAVGWSMIDWTDFGIPNFLVWRLISGKAHGGQRVNLGAVRLYYETFGAGPPVLVMHGGMASLEAMHNQIVSLASSHFVLAPDSRGHGRSTDGQGPLHYQDMAADMIALMDRMHIARTDVVGWSDGGIIGLDMAMRHPARVARLVVISANFDVRGLGGSADDARQRLDPLTVAHAIYRRLQPPSPSQRVRDDRVSLMWRTEPHFTLADLARIQCPVLVIAGEHDDVRREHTDALARAIPGAREVIIPGADHMAPLRTPKPIDAQIRDFLAGAELAEGHANPGPIERPNKAHP